MVLNSHVVVGVARVSANACNPERLSSDLVLHLIFCFPFQQLRRLAVCLWNFLCFPTPDNNPFFISSSSSSDADVYDLDQDPHSD